MAMLAPAGEALGVGVHMAPGLMVAGATVSGGVTVAATTGRDVIRGGISSAGAATDLVGRQSSLPIFFNGEMP